MKQFYQVPSIKVVSFKVEEGFQSQLNVGERGDLEAVPPIEPAAGIQAFGNGGSYGTVFGDRN